MDNIAKNQRIDRIKNTFTIGFGILLTLSIFVWIIGWVTMVAIPLFGGIRADEIGKIGMASAGFGELSVYLFTWLLRKS